MKKPSRWIGVALSGSLLAGLAGCASDEPAAMAQRPAIVAARKEAAARAEAALAKLVGDGKVLGTSRVDWCDPGQSNFKVKDPYKFQCGLERGALVVPLQATVEDAVAALQAASADAGCPIADIDASTIPADRATGLLKGASSTCDGAFTLAVRWGFDSRGFPSSVPLPNGFVLDSQVLSADALAEARAASPVGWYVLASIRYDYEPR